MSIFKSWFGKEGRKPGTPVEFLGWIPGYASDREILKQFGVKGKMIWEPVDNSKSDFVDQRDKTGVFSYCSITLDMVPVLLQEFPAFCPTVFTGLNADGDQTLDQPLWNWEY